MTQAPAPADRPIGDYALIGDTRTAALVARDGSIDWYCPRRFDAPAVFCRLLDARKGGYWRVGPVGRHRASRAYLGDTNVLVTTFTTGGGRVRLTDLMPLPAPGRDARGGGATAPRILRLVEGLAGEVEIDVAFRPTFDYARAATVVTPSDGGAVALAGGETLTLACPAELAVDGSGAARGRLRLAAGERLWLALTDRPGGAHDGEDVGDCEAALARTTGYWREWSAGGTYDGPYRELVRRGALVVELLTYEPTGALVAAPTTSLPEEIGGVRNWDYRYTWLRDSALVLDALMAIGHHGAAMRFWDWLERLCLCCPGDPQTIYRVDGGAELPERALDHLDGYRGSRPVRIGNAAAGQTQLDVYGEVLDAAYLCFERMRPPEPALWVVLRRLADQAAARWRESDQGIWEVRGGPRHFLYSKLLCWVALDRAIRLARREELPGDVGRWRRTRNAIRRAILVDGYDAELGAFTQALGEPALDASALAIPRLGFLPATDPRVRSTVERVRARLTARGLVYRYLTDDGLPGGGATFALCTFWLVDGLALAGRVDEARELFERLVGYANDVGLMAEEIDPASGELLGNFPQAFSHLALIRSAVHVAAAAERRSRTHQRRRASADRPVTPGQR